MLATEHLNVFRLQVDKVRRERFNFSGDLRIFLIVMGLVPIPIKQEKLLAVDNPEEVQPFSAHRDRKVCNELFLRFGDLIPADISGVFA